MKPKISLITLGVRDFDRAFAFYSQGLGFEAHNHAEGEDFCMFRLEGTWLALFPRDQLAADAGIEDDGRAPAGFARAHNVGSETEVDAVFAKAIAAGGHAQKAPQKTFWGGYSGYFADPDGHLWEVAHNPFTDLT